MKDLYTALSLNSNLFKYLFKTLNIAADVKDFRVKAPIYELLVRVLKDKRSDIYYFRRRKKKEILNNNCCFLMIVYFFNNIIRTIAPPISSTGLPRISNPWLATSVTFLAVV